MFRLFPGLVLYFALSALAVSQSSFSQPQAASPSAAPTQTSEPSNKRDSQTPASSPTPSPGDSTRLEPIKTQKADYPIRAAREGLQGEVLVRVFISETGDVETVEVLKGDPILAEAAVAAAKKWKFKPFIRGGKPIKIATKMPFDFAFDDKVEDTTPPPTAPADNGGDTTRVLVSQGISVGLLIHKVQPIYPESARSNRVQGTVTLRAMIGKDGRIENLTPISGPKELIPAAVGAVQQWRYKPYFFQGKPVEVETQVVVNFKLSGW